MNKHLMGVAGVVLSMGIFLVGCGAQVGSGSEIKQSPGGSKKQCMAEYNKPSNPCRISIYELIAHPEKWSGMYLEFLAYAPANGVRLLFANKDASEFEDYQSSFLILNGEESKIKREGYVLVTVRFDNDKRDYGISSGVGGQIGAVREMTVRKHVVALSKRREECVTQGCFVEYLDGD